MQTNYRNPSYYVSGTKPKKKHSKKAFFTRLKYEGFRYTEKIATYEKLQKTYENKIWIF